MDQSLVDSSPWLFAATHVLHRHLAPRHPPLALRSLGYSLVFLRFQTRLVSLMLVLAMQFSRDRCGDGVATRPSRSTDCELMERVGETRSTPASGRRRLLTPSKRNSE